MKTKMCIAIVLAAVSCFSLKGTAVEPSATMAATAATSPAGEMSANMPVFKKLEDIKWEKILPELGENSPEISFLHVDPTTKAAKLLIRAPKAIHIRKHWHSANETHTIISGVVAFMCEGQRLEMGPGSFNYMPAKMVHEAWLPAGSLTFITVDGAWDVNWVEGPPTSADLSRTY